MTSYSPASVYRAIESSHRESFRKVNYYDGDLSVTQRIHFGTHLQRHRLPTGDDGYSMVCRRNHDDRLRKLAGFTNVSVDVVHSTDWTLVTHAETLNVFSFCRVRVLVTRPSPSRLAFSAAEGPGTFSAHQASRRTAQQLVAV